MTVSVIAHGNRLASLGQKIIITVEDDSITVKAPFYRCAIAVTNIAAVKVSPDDGKNHGLLNWFVTGRADSPHGVRINNGGKARVDILMEDGARYGVVVDTLEQATQIVNAIEAESLPAGEKPTNS